MNKYRVRLATQLCSIVFLTLFFAASASAQTRAANVTPPEVPHDVQVETGNEVFLVGHAVGTQNYVCVPCDQSKPGCPNGVAFTLFTPQATLFNDQGKQIITHFFSPNPFEVNTDSTVIGDHLIRATWEDSHDTSTVWAKVAGMATVAKDAIAWVLLNVKDTGAQGGTMGVGKLAETTFIQRVNTEKGLPPSEGCNSPAQIGNKAFVPYKADYIFYKKASANSGDDK